MASLSLNIGKEAKDSNLKADMVPRLDGKHELYDDHGNFTRRRKTRAWTRTQ